MTKKKQTAAEMAEEKAEQRQAAEETQRALDKKRAELRVVAKAEKAARSLLVSDVSFYLFSGRLGTTLDRIQRSYDDWRVRAADLESVLSEERDANNDAAAVAMPLTGDTE